MAELIQIDYDFLIEYFNTELNAIGATTSLTLRTVDTIAGDTAYVRKFGTDYLIKSVSDIEDPINVNMTFTVKSKTTDTTLGSRVGGGAFVAGSTLTTAEGCYLEISASGGAVVVLATILIDTDVDAGGLDFICAAETVADGDTLPLYLSDTSSTYYDSEYMYGGGRHTPALNNIRLPYRTQNLALAAIVTANDDGCITLDSESYDEEIDWNLADSFCLALLGQTPTLTKGIGVRTTRSTTQEFNNINSLYVNINGDDSTGTGTWQNPYKTFEVAYNNIAGRSIIVFGGINATADEIFSFDFIDLAQGLTIESDYNYIRTITKIGVTVYMINFPVNNTLEINGIKLSNITSPQGAVVSGGAANPNQVVRLNDCTFMNCDRVLALSGAFGDYYIDDCYAENCDSIMYSGSPNAPSGYYARRNILKNVLDLLTTNQIFAQTLWPHLHNNICIDSRSLCLINGSNLGGTVVEWDVNNNFIYNCTYGLAYFDSGTYSAGTHNIDNNIFHSITDTALLLSTDANTTVENNCFFNNTADTFGTVTNTAPINFDPQICSIVNSHYGIKPTSPCYRAGNDSDDVGIKTRIIEINESNITINGFIIDGQNGYSNGLFIVDTANHTDLIVKWCTVKRFIGGGGDMYDDNTALDIQLLNCNFNNNGYGIGLHYGGNIITECLFFKDSAQNLYLDQASHTINHCVLYGGGYGIYLDTNVSGFSIKNSIANSNSINNIFSVQSINSSSITYCNITGLVTSNVDITNTTNINVDPLFININTDSENFNIKTKETNILDSNGNITGQYQTNSGCKDKSDGILYVDIGVYGVNRGIEEQAWKKYVFENNPTNLDDQNMPKDPIENTDALGSDSSWAKAHKNNFPLVWAENQYSTDNQKDYIKYFNSSRPTRELGKNKTNTRLRFKRLPLTFIESGTGGVLSSLVLTDSSKTLVPDKVKGYYMGLKFDSQTNYVIDATAKTATSSGAGFTVNEHTGRFLKYNGYSYYVKSNTTTALALSDPFSTLVDATSQSLSIELYFEIKTNNETTYTLLDPDSLLVDGNYNYYIDYAMTRPVVQDFNSTQPIYNPVGVKTGYSLTLGQI